MSSPTTTTMLQIDDPVVADENSLGPSDANKMLVKNESPEESTTKGKNTNKKKKHGSKSKGGTPSKLGRKGDPRMHRAVACRLADPNMSLLDALRAGGFKFPDLENGGGDEKILDADSVQLCQRKNQLSRRLRLARQQAAQAAENASVKKRQSSGGDTDAGAHHSRQDETLDAEAQARMQILLRHSDLTEEQARRFVKKSSADSNKQKAIQDAAQALLEEEATHRGEVEPFLKRKASGISGDDSIDYCANEPEINIDEEDMDLALGRHGRIAKNHPKYASQQQALTAGQVRVEGDNRRSTSVMNASPAEAAAALPAAVATLQRLTGNGGSALAGLNAPGGAGAHVNDAGGHGAAGRSNTLSVVAEVGSEPRAEQKRTSDSASVSSSASSHLAKQAESLGLSREQLKSVLISGGINQNILDDVDDTEGMKKDLNQTKAGLSVGEAKTFDNSDVASVNMVRKGNEMNFSRDFECKMNMALDFHRAETASLLKRCMIMAGFEPDETEECDSTYLEFVRRATVGETKRIDRLCRNLRVGPYSQSSDSHRGSCSDSPSKKRMRECGRDNIFLPEKVKPVPEKTCGHQKSGEGNEEKCFDGRHVHQLEGRCGHQAIIHQPEDGKAHVDFIVNGKVECYEGIKPLGSNSACWPSTYTCDDLGECSVNANHEVKCGKDTCEKKCSGRAEVPKIYPLSEIDFNGDEWCSAMYSGDESLLGLMGLANPTEAHRTQHIECN